MKEIKRLYGNRLEAFRGIFLMDGAPLTSHAIGQLHLASTDALYRIWGGAQYKWLRIPRGLEL